MESIRDGRLRRDSQIKGLYEFEKTLGKGHFAIVKLAKHVYTGERVAIKVIDKSKLDQVSRAHLYQEVACMKMVKHENIVQLYEVIDSNKFLYIVQELGDGGDMYDFLMKHEGGLPEEKARDFFQQIVSAISYCHDLHIVHRDLKPENVVLSRSQDVVKITDFGFSNQYTPGKHLHTSCGSLAYSAPEILLGDSYEAAAVDVWSLGVLLYMLVCGEAPFNEATDSETLTMIMDCRFNLPADLSEECKDLVSHLLRREPSERLTLADIIAHPWMQGTFDDASLPLSPSSPSHETMSHVSSYAGNLASAGRGSGSTRNIVNSSSTSYNANSTAAAVATTIAATPATSAGLVNKLFRKYPVITREMITEEEHREIVDCMTTQNIADEKAIIESLDTKAYDHISATYFLLAEKRLRLQNDERLKALSGAANFIGLGGQLNSLNSHHTNPNSASIGGNPPVTISNPTSQCAGRCSPQPHPTTMNSMVPSAIPVPQSQKQQPQQLNPSRKNNSGTGVASHSIEQYPLALPPNLSPVGSTEKPSFYLGSNNQSTKLSMLPLSGRSGSNSFAEDQCPELSVRRNSESSVRPKTQRSWSAGPGISTAIVQQQSCSLSERRDRASPSPPPPFRSCGGNSFESLATGSSSATRVPHREHLTIAPSYNRNILKEDISKLSEDELRHRVSVSMCENDIPNLLLVSANGPDSVSKSKVSSTSRTGTLQSSRLSEPHAGLGKLVEEEGESELDDFEDGGTGPFLGRATNRSSRGQGGSSFKARNNSAGALFSRKQQHQQRRLSAGHSPEFLRKSNNKVSAPLTSSSSGGVATNYATSRRSTPTRSHYNSDESGGEDGDNRLRIKSTRFSESDRTLGGTLRQHLARQSFNHYSDDSSVERHNLFNSNPHTYNNAPLASMERNDLLGSSHSTPNNRRHRRKKKSVNENLKMSNLSVSSMVSAIGSKYPIDPSNNTPSDSDSVSSRKASSYTCNRLVDPSDSEGARLVVSSNKHCSSGMSTNLIKPVEEEEPVCTGGSGYLPRRHTDHVMGSSNLSRSGGYQRSLSSDSGGHSSLKGKANVKCEYNQLDKNTTGTASAAATSTSSTTPKTRRAATIAKKINQSQTDGRKRRSRKVNKSSKTAKLFSSCMKKGEVSTASVSEDLIDSSRESATEKEKLLHGSEPALTEQPRNRERCLYLPKGRKIGYGVNTSDINLNTSLSPQTDSNLYGKASMDSLKDLKSEAGGDASVAVVDSSQASRCCGIQ